MAIGLLSHVVSDLILGKPALPWLPSNASVRDALRALKQLGDGVSELSIWDCSGKICSHDIGDPLAQSDVGAHINCRCVGKVCMQKIVCHLASEKSLFDFPEALDVPVSSLLEHNATNPVVQHVDPDASLLEALDLIARGVQNLVIPITCKSIHNVKQVKVPKDHGRQEYCWLTPEDVLRFLLGSISIFSPLPALSIEALGIIRCDVQMIEVGQDACSELELIEMACQDSSAVAIVDSTTSSPGTVHFVGDISCSALQTCNELASLALISLSAGDFLAFVQECREPPQILVDIIQTRVHEKLGLGMLSR
ncbi:hypothetical protein KP509_23G005900 [Ceratopteris richardii]|uniref:Uncharacterized protein n=1 Tax=Ceratopteris richardii TaxID=49495 RepID=A0A8T2RZX5_CERRI|nr:hypothetical protein KP509_23G005900 [Ceratopteris richardii]